MKKPENWDEAQENALTEILKEQPPAGGAVFHILGSLTSIENGVETLWLKMDVLNTNGTGDKFKFYFSRLFEVTGEEFLIRSKFSKENIGRLKAFITCVTDANEGFKWAWDEKKLLFKNVAGNLRYREWKTRSGNIIIIPYIVNFCRLESVVNVKPLPVRKLDVK